MVFGTEGTAEIRGGGIADALCDLANRQTRIGEKLPRDATTQMLAVGERWNSVCVQKLSAQLAFADVHHRGKLCGGFGSSIVQSNMLGDRGCRIRCIARGLDGGLCILVRLEMSSCLQQKAGKTQRNLSVDRCIGGGANARDVGKMLGGGGVPMKHGGDGFGKALEAIGGGLIQAAQKLP